MKMVLVLAKLRMGPLTMSIPRSSEAFSWGDRGSSGGAGGLSLSPQSWVPPPGYPSLYLQHHGAELSVPVELPGTRQDGGGLAGAGGAIKEEVGQAVLADEPLDWRRECRGVGEGGGSGDGLSARCGHSIPGGYWWGW